MKEQAKEIVNKVITEAYPALPGEQPDMLRLFLSATLKAVEREIGERETSVRAFLTLYRFRLHMAEYTIRSIGASLENNETHS